MTQSKNGLTFFLIGVQLIYNTVIVPSVQHSDSVFLHTPFQQRESRLHLAMLFVARQHRWLQMAGLRSLRAKSLFSHLEKHRTGLQNLISWTLILCPPLMWKGLQEVTGEKTDHHSKDERRAGREAEWQLFPLWQGCWTPGLGGKMEEWEGAEGKMNQSNPPPSRKPAWFWMHPLAVRIS